MSSVSNFIDFYRKCYRADNRDLSIWNVLKTDEYYWLDSSEEELATGRMPRIPVPLKEAELLFKKSKIHIREKTLVYGIIFVSGKLSGLSGFVSHRDVCSPLVYFDAKIELENENYYFRIDINNPHINTSLLSEIIKADESNISMRDFPVISGSIDNVVIGDIANWLDDQSIVDDMLKLLSFPKLLNKADYTKSYKGQEPLSALPCAALVLVDRPKASRGILHELKTIASDTDYSAPVRALFSSVNEKTSAKHIDVDNIPGLLSPSQIKALEIANQYTLGLVSGPPGTGKSYTIAAIALDRLLQGERVLIVSETDQSIDVINEKLTNDFNANNVVLRAGKSSFLKKLKTVLDGWLKHGVEPVDDFTVTRLHKSLKHSKRLIVKQENKFIKRANQSMRWGKVLAKNNNKEKLSIIDRITKSYIDWRIRQGDLHWDQIDELESLLKRRDLSAAEYLNLHMKQCISKLLNEHRSQLSKFNMAIRARTSQKQLSLHSEIDYELIFNAFPVWLATLDIIHHVLPLKNELFDLVIIDEATQCNIASVLPALQRAKRALIVGDNKQLKHVSFLPFKKEQEMFLSCGLENQEYEAYSYRKNSILDLVSNSINSQKAVVMLDEHFRSKPDLIAFSNQKFYDGRLKVMQHRPDQHMVGNIIVKKIQGQRDTKGVNKLEAQAVIDQVREMIEQYESMDIKPTIGIISPYREQVNYLQKQLLKLISMNEIEQHAIRVATPYGFQGDEKDYILMSMSIDDESRRAAAYLNREDMFNVAITRARQFKYVFASTDHLGLPSTNLFREYMESLVDFTEEYSAQPSGFDEFQDEVCEALHVFGVITRKTYPVAGRNVDILCSKNNKSIAVDLIGFPGEYAGFFELSTYYLFSRACLDVFPLSYGLWSLDKDLCITEVLKRLN